MKASLSNPNKSLSLELDHFRVRLFARIAALVLFIVHFGQRLYAFFTEKDLKTSSIVAYSINIPFVILIMLLVFTELLMYKKLRAKVLKYSKIVSGLFYVIFIAEWITMLYVTINQAQKGDKLVYGASAVFGFASFSWRTMLQNFIVQNWQLKVIPPLVAYVMVMAFAGHYEPHNLVFTLLRGITQVLLIIFIFYLEEKVNFKLLKLNDLQQDKWVRINEFILDNIPEKIAILDLGGELQYLTEYFKNYIKRFGSFENINQFFQEVRNLQILNDDHSQSTQLVKTIFF